MKRIFDNEAVRFAIFIGIVAACILLGSVFSVDREQVSRLLQNIPLGFASVVFVFLYVVGTFIIWYLKDPLKIVGAVIFGAYVSTLLIYIAEIINAYIFFHISSILGKDFVERKLTGKFKKFYEKADTMSLGWIFILRAIPLIPYRVLDLTFGLSKVSFRKYLIAVLLASPPRIFWIQFIAAGLSTFTVEGMMEYFQHNIAIYCISFFYFIFAFIAAIMLRRKLR